MICRHFGICGGCFYQHLSYDDELKEKEKFVKELFSFTNVFVLPILGSPSIWNYRNKMEFTFRQSLKKDTCGPQKFLGLLGKKGRVENLKECLLSPPWFLEVMQKVYDFWTASELEAYYPPKNIGTLRTLTLREGSNTSEKMIILTISGDEAFSMSDEAVKSFCSTLLPLNENDTIILRKQIAVIKQPTRFEEIVLFGKGYIHEILHGKNKSPFRFKIKPSSFFQPNTRQAEILYQKAIELANFSPDETIFDLYCGTGTIGIFLSPQVKKVIGIESENSSVEDGIENIHRNGIKNMEIMRSPIEEFSSSHEPDSIIIDPPRTGLTDKAFQKILSFSPRKILYISCNPITQAANIKEFMNHGYQPTAIQPIDQFPRTKHVENIVVLKKE